MEPSGPLLEPFKRKKSGGSPPLDFRCILNGIFYLLKTGCQWGYLPSCYGSKSAVHAHSKGGCMPGCLPRFSVYPLKNIKS
ncbi:transposase [Candidatus Contendibacter odensensis]|uniref:transposase n=1 Tax=Candidatus Contendibacter odensensis TaxID=1400860 RepID=UPI003B9694D1